MGPVPLVDCSDLDNLVAAGFADGIVVVEVDLFASEHFAANLAFDHDGPDVVVEVFAAFADVERFDVVRFDVERVAVDRAAVARSADSQPGKPGLLE